MNKKINPILAILILFLVVAAVGVVSWWVAQQESNQILRQLPEKQVAQSTPKEDEIKNWQTYRSEEHGFEIKYPSIYRVFEPYHIVPDGALFEIESVSSKQKNVAFGGDIPSNFIANYSLIHVYDIDKNRFSNQDQKEFKDFSLALIKDGFSIEEILLNNIKVSQFTKKHILKEYNVLDRRLYLFKNHQGYLISANSIFDNSSEEIPTIADQIISTFKFIDSTTLDTSNWQTYRNEKYGLEFRYPSEWRPVASIVNNSKNLTNFTDLSKIKENKIIFPFNPDRTIEVYYINNHFITADVIDKTLIEYNKEMKNEFLSKKEEMIINNKKWYYYEYNQGYANLNKIIFASPIKSKVDEKEIVLMVGFSTPNFLEIDSFKEILRFMVYTFNSL